MKANRPPLPCPISSRLRRHWAAPLAALLAAVTPVKADHLFNAWTQQFDLNSTSPSQAEAVATDSHGNIIVAGELFSSNSITQWYVAKYDALDGELIAGGVVLGPNNAGPGQAAPIDNSVVRSIAVDSQDNVYVAGGTEIVSAQGEDIELMKLSPSLQPLWVRSRANAGDDELEKVVLDSAGNPYVTGFLAVSGQGRNILTIAYSSGGTLSHQAQYNSSGNIDDVPADMAISADGQEIYVVGSSGPNANAEALVTLLYNNTLTLNSFFPQTHQPSDGSSTAAGVALDSAGNAFVTATDADPSGDKSLYTVKYNTTGIAFWEDNFSLRSDDFDAQAGGISVGPDDNPVITGVVDDGTNNGETLAVTIKYKGSAPAAGSRLWVAADPGLSPEDPNFKGFPQFSSAGKKVFVDAGGTVNMVGETALADLSPITYVARYNGADGTRLFDSVFDNGFGSHNDRSMGIASDATGNVSIVATIRRPTQPADPGTTVTSFIDGILTQKFQRLIAETNDALPADPTGNVARKVSILDAPALADSGDIAAKIIYTEGKSKLMGILTQGPEGGSVLPAVQKMAAPNVPGFASATFASFADPVVSPDGHYAFPATLGGVPGARAKSLWTNLGGTLHLALQEGSPVPGLNTASVVSIMSIAMRDTQLLALIKVNGAASMNTVLLSLDAANTGTVLLRTGDMQTVNSVTSAVKSITVLSPSPNTAGDGRWQGDADAVAKAVMSDKAKSTVIFKITPAASITPLLFTGQDASTIAGTTDTWATFGFPAVGPTGADFAALGTLKTSSTVKAATENVILLNAGTGFQAVAREGDPVDAATGLGDVSYDSLNNPVADKTGEVAFLTTIKELPAHTTKVTAADNHVLLYGDANGVSTIARTGEKAPDISGTPTMAAFSSFVSFALPGGTPASLGVPLVQLKPIFVAKISGKGVTAKNNLGVWGVDSANTLRCLLHTGEKLGTQTVTKITLLTATTQSFAATRSFNAYNSVVMLVAFSDHTTGILEVQVP